MLHSKRKGMNSVYSLADLSSVRSSTYSDGIRRRGRRQQREAEIRIRKEEGSAPQAGGMQRGSKGKTIPADVMKARALKGTAAVEASHLFVTLRTVRTGTGISQYVSISLPVPRFAEILSPPDHEAFVPLPYVLRP